MPQSAAAGTGSHAGVTLTPAAARAIAGLMVKGAAKGVRLGITRGGCAGMEYSLGLAREVAPDDEVIEQDGARVLVAPEALAFLAGTRIDHESGPLSSGFRFDNPNVTDSCGCGTSIRFDPAPGAA